MRRSQPWRTVRSRTLRANETSAEARMWRALRNRQLAGNKFVRQAAVGAYFVDFLCREHRVIVEIDGATHGEDAELRADATRTLELKRLGYRDFRAQNEDVYRNLDGVLSTLLAFVEDNHD